MKILLVTDAWLPQTNGVVRTLQHTIKECKKAGHEVEIISPADGFFTIALPTYKEIRLAVFAKHEVERRMVMFGPDAVHIATEGPLGWAARSLCLKWGKDFTTSYHTQFPEYIKARFGFIPLGWGYKFVRRFHNASGRIMVATASMQQKLQKRGFENLAIWARGVDLSRFGPDARFNLAREKFGADVYADLKRPIFVNVGRVAVEKNIEAFLELDLPGSKIVVGDGPALGGLKRKYKDKALFVGAKYDEELVRYYADADVMVFPSKTDTFGLVIIEAMACGTPVAAYPAVGPVDIIPGSGAGIIADDLQKACMDALKLDRQKVAEYAQKYSWEKVAQSFVDLLVPEVEAKRRLRWRRARRAIKLASAPWRIFKKLARRIGRFIKTGR